jgi:hypothetical protein
MAHLFDRLFSWTHKATSHLAELYAATEILEPPPPAADQLIYRLRHWPRIPSTWKTADILRTLSVMSSRPVNRRWIAGHSRLDPRGVDLFVQMLVDQGAVDIVDPTQFQRRASTA